MSFPTEAKINKQLLNKVQAQLKNEAPAKRLEIKDTELKGYRLRVEPSGRISYYLYARIGKGRTAPLICDRIGTLPMTPDQARAAAQIKKTKALQGEDPRTEKIDDDTNPKLRVIADMFLEVHSKPHKSASESKADAQKFGEVCKYFGANKRIRSFDRSDIISFHNSRKDTPYQANRYLSLLSKFFNFCEDMNKRDPNSNPCRRIKKFKEYSRERPLEMEELERIGEQLNMLERTRATIPQNIAIIRMLIFSGRRLGDIITLKRENMDWERNRYRKLTKGGDYEWLQFNSHCIDILRSIPEVEGNPYFFASNVTEGQHLTHPKKFWYDKVRTPCGIEDVRLHDLRHTHATIARACNMDLGLVGKLLGHKSHLTTKRYAHVYDMEKIQATEHVGNVIHGVFGKNAEDTTGVQQAMEAMKTVLDQGKLNPVALAQLVTAIHNLAPNVDLSEEHTRQLANIITNMLAGKKGNVVAFPAL